MRTVLRRALAFARLLVPIAGLLGTFAQTAQAAEPAAKAIDAAVQLQFPNQSLWGMSIAIVHGGRVTYNRAFGVRANGAPDRFIADDHDYYNEPVPSSPRAPADSRTIYEIGSVTKQFTAAAILQLVEDHKLGLDEPVANYVSSFTDRALTIRTLLNQRSGLPDFNSLSFLQRVKPLARRPDGSLDSAVIVRGIAALPRDFAPGARFEYSTSNYYVLGTIVERVAREPLGDYLTKKIFEPLGMTRTAYARTAAADDVALGYRLDDKNGVWRAYPWNLAWLGGAGAMTSTVDDLARWNVALVAHRVVQPVSLAAMWHGINAGPGQGSYAMGWIEDALGTHRYLWHNGEVGGFHALNVLFPDDDLAFSILTNNQDANTEYLIPTIASLYFPVVGLDKILPRSGVVLVEASFTIALGALAVAVIAVSTLRRFIVAGVIAAVLATMAGFFLPSVIGFVWAGLAALVPTGVYVLAALRIPRREAIPVQKVSSRR